MPELPEVETIVNGIKQFTENQTIKSCKVRVEKLRWKLDKRLDKKIINSKILGVKRRAKYIIIQTNKNYIIFHLGMTGSLRISKENKKNEKHNHIIFKLSNGFHLLFYDVRKFGMIFVTQEDPEKSHELLTRLGVEPLTKEFNQNFLFKLTRGKKVNVKSLIMNANYVVGVGNIYANESLFLSGILPTRIASKLSKDDCKILVQSIKNVLRKAIRKGGSSIKDYIDADGKEGYFQYDFKVYSRAGEPCYNCSNTILKITINQRASYLCSNCQK